jgi:hypothetical protein
VSGTAYAFFTSLDPFKNSSSLRSVLASAVFQGLEQALYADDVSSTGGRLSRAEPSEQDSIADEVFRDAP